MGKYCGVRLNPNGKVYSFSYTNQKIQEGDLVVVETQHGLKIGEVMRLEEEPEGPKEGLKSVVRVATDKDFEIDAENLELAKNAFKACAEKIDELKLEMKLFKAEYTLDRQKVMFQYVSEARVDFRELVKELVPIVKTRIEMIQVGPREHAKFVGGLGMCGRQFCCQKFMTMFEPVTIKMAKDQGLTSNPTKYSGNCGKLLCCIRHEEPAYEYAQGILPKNGAIVATPDGLGKINVVNMLKETCSVRVGTEANFEIKSYKASEIRTPTEEEKNEYLLARKREKEEIDQHKEQIKQELSENGNVKKEHAERNVHHAKQNPQASNEQDQKHNSEKKQHKSVRHKHRPKNNGNGNENN